MEPRKLGRYEIVEELGRGAMGRVLLAHDPQIDRQVAVKIVQSFAALPPHEAEEARRRFLAEARAAGKLLHPGIVTLFDAGETDGTLYLAMEYVQGRTLDEFCKADALLPVSTVRDLVADVAEALSYAHRNGIVHRDIKPANLMRTLDGAVKVMDFGLARGAEASLTKDGATLGTPSYMSPEQIRGGAIDGRSDLFSLGVVLYEMLTGEKPFAGDTISSVIYRIVNDDPRQASVVHGRVGPDFDGFLRRALAKDPKLRFHNGEEFATALRAIAAVKPVSGDVEAAPPAPPAPAVAEIAPIEKQAPARSSPVPFIIAIVLTLAALGAGVYLLGERLGWFDRPPEVAPVFEATVRTQPAEAHVLIDGEPVDLEQGGVVRFASTAPYGLLTAEYRCRREEYPLQPADHGAEIELVLEPVELVYPLQAAVPAATVRVNGDALGPAPLSLELDLCRANTVTVAADGFREFRVEVPEAATPLQARTLLETIELRPIPKGRLMLPRSPVNLVHWVDDERVGQGPRELELAEGEHRVRSMNDQYWIDVTQTVRVVADEVLTLEPALPELVTLVVLAYPPNCKVELRRPGGSWKYLDEVPVRRKLASGKYEVRVTLNPTGESRVRDVELTPGGPAEVRVSFGSAS